MSLQLVGISVVIPLSKIYEVYEGGKEAFWRDNHPSEDEYDGELIRMSFSNAIDAEIFVQEWKRRGLKTICTVRNKKYWQDLCVVDRFSGPTLPCEWLEYDPHKCIANQKHGVPQMNQEEFQQILDNLHKSPLFQLSLGSKELFHSNFLAWCCENWPDEMASAWRSLLPDLKGVAIKKGKDGVRREYKNHDLEVEFDSDELLVLELKVKSVPDEKQLIGYSKDVLSRPGNKAYFALISPVRPSFFSDNKFEVNGTKTVWYWLGLEEVAKTLQESLEKVVSDSYEKELLEDYNNFTKNLTYIMQKVDINLSSNESFFIEKKIMDKIRDLRLHDLVDKYCYGQLCAKIKDAIKGTLSEEEEINVTAEMSNGTGLVTVSYPILPPFDIGIQLQGRQFRLYISVKGAKDDPVIAEIMEKAIDYIEDKKLWFAFNDNSVFESNCMRSSQCQYNGVFRYKYRLLKNITTLSLIELMKKYLIQVHDQREKIKRVIRDLDVNNRINTTP